MSRVHKITIIFDHTRYDLFDIINQSSKISAYRKIASIYSGWYLDIFLGYVYNILEEFYFNIVLWYIAPFVAEAGIFREDQFN